MSEAYLVTGAAGHLGTAVVRQLLTAGKTVRILVVKGEKEIPEGDVSLYFGDVRSRESLRPFFEYAPAKGEELIVIHCAGIVSIASGFSQLMYEVNVRGTDNILSLCSEYKIKKLVYVSSVHAIPEQPYGIVMTEIRNFRPEFVMGNYARTKAAATANVLSAARHGLDAVVVHPSGLIGPYDCGRGHMTKLVIDYCKGRLISGVEGGYDFVDVRDAAAGIISAAEKGRAGECYILSNRYYSIREILGNLHDITGMRIIRTYLPLRFVQLTAGLSETYYKMLHQTPLYTPYSIYSLTSNSLFSHEKASRELDYSTRDMRLTLEDTVAWLKMKSVI